MINNKDKISDEEFIERYSKEELEFLKAWENLRSDEDFQKVYQAIKKSIEERGNKIK